MIFLNTLRVNYHVINQHNINAQNQNTNILKEKHLCRDIFMKTNTDYMIIQIVTYNHTR